MTAMRPAKIRLRTFLRMLGWRLFRPSWRVEWMELTDNVRNVHELLVGRLDTSVIGVRARGYFSMLFTCALRP